MSDPKGSIFTSLMLFAFIGIFGYDLIVYGLDNPSNGDSIYGIVWIVIVFIALTFTIVDHNKKHPELDEVDDA
mgnify:CR=1 FL=1|jgi:type IV secretory pathway TrbL component|tara:strand:- start:1055 stop:1273 length:219 start_codon:yes stop_codon:yes gene_type:complete